MVPLPLRILIVALAALALVLGGRSRLITRRARRLERQRGELLRDVGLLQAALLPVVPDRLGSVRASVAYQPADGPAAGGDFYDVFELGDGQLGIIVGDLSGHGRRALPHTALVRFTLRAYLEAGLSPKHAIQSAEPILERQLGDSYATVVVGTFDRDERRLVYASAGHPPPVIAASRPLVPVAFCCAPPIGLVSGTGTRQTTVHLPGRALVCFYTDGVVEAHTDGAPLGTIGLERLLGELDAEPSAQALLDKVDSQIEARRDDMAACLLALEGDDSAPCVRTEELELIVSEMVEEQLARFLTGFALAPSQIGQAEQRALSYLRRGRNVTVEVGLDGERPEVRIRPGELSLFNRPPSTKREQRRIAQ